MTSKLQPVRSWLVALAAAVVLAGAGVPDSSRASDEELPAEEDWEDEEGEDTQGWRWSSLATVGHRSLSLEGSDALYRSLIDRSPGVRLLDLEIGGDTARPAESFADEFKLRARGFGGEPEQDLRLELARRGHYKLDIGLQRVDSVFDVPSYQLGQHSSDRQRERIRLGLTTHFGRVSAWLRLGRSEKEGPGTTTQVLGSNEFLLEDRLERKSETLLVGARFPLGPATLTLQQHWAQTERNDVYSLAPGAEEGNQSSSELAGWDRESSSSSDSRTTSLALQVPFKSRAELSARFSYGDGDTDSLTERDAAQVRPGPPSGIRRMLVSAGAVDRSLRVGEIGFTIHATDRLSVHETLRLRSVDSWGDLAATTTVLIGTRETITDIEGLTSYDERSLENELGLSYRFPRRVLLRVGLRHRDRELDWEKELADEAELSQVEHSDARLFAGASWRPGTKVHLQGELEVGDQSGSGTEPSLLLRTAPSQTAALGLRLRVHPSPSSSVGFALRYRHGENSELDAAHHEDLFSVAVTGELRLKEKLELLGSLTRRHHDASTLLDITVNGERGKPTQLYRLRETGLDLTCVWRPQERLSLALRFHGTDATGSLPTRWYQLEPSVSFRGPSGWEWRVGYLISRYAREQVPDENFRAKALVTSISHVF